VEGVRAGQVFTFLPEDGIHADSAGLRALRIVRAAAVAAAAATAVVVAAAGRGVGAPVVTVTVAVVVIAARIVEIATEAGFAGRKLKGSPIFA
jgi:hypothetical protein